MYILKKLLRHDSYIYLENNIIILRIYCFNSELINLSMEGKPGKIFQDEIIIETRLIKRNLI